jgi:protocatechuate 3,4-dioxygenase beta subunit
VLFLTLRKVIFIAAILLAMMQIAGTEKLGITGIVLDANGNPVERHQS